MNAKIDGKYLVQSFDKALRDAGLPDEADALMMDAEAGEAHAGLVWAAYVAADRKVEVPRDVLVKTIELLSSSSLYSCGVSPCKALLKQSEDADYAS